MRKYKIKITIKPPRCVKCRERAQETDMEDLGKIIAHLIKNKTGVGIPIQLTIEKFTPPQPQTK